MFLEYKSTAIFRNMFISCRKHVACKIIVRRKKFKMISIFFRNLTTVHSLKIYRTINVAKQNKVAKVIFSLNIFLTHYRSKSIFKTIFSILFLL